MPRSPMAVSLPSFHGATRRILVTALVVYFTTLLVSLVSPGLAALVNTLMLHPDEALGRYIWQFVTYPFISLSLLGLLLSAISIWYFASALEAERGALWLGEYFFASTVGGSLLACVLSRTLLAQLVDPGERTYGLWPAVLAMILAYARFHPDQELTFNFVIKLKAKYLAAIYLLIYLAVALSSHARLDAMTALCAALCGYAYLQFAPRRGLRFAASEQWFGLRNAYYRQKRRRAAKKFTVYMRKQGKDVSLDASGKYVSLEDERKYPTDKRWMN